MEPDRTLKPEHSKYSDLYIGLYEFLGSAVLVLMFNFSGALAV